MGRQRRNRELSWTAWASHPHGPHHRVGRPTCTKPSKMSRARLSVKICRGSKRSNGFFRSAISAVAWSVPCASDSSPRTIRSCTNKLTPKQTCVSRQPRGVGCGGPASAGRVAEGERRAGKPRAGDQVSGQEGRIGVAMARRQGAVGRLEPAGARRHLEKIWLAHGGMNVERARRVDAVGRGSSVGIRVHCARRVRSRARVSRARGWRRGHRTHTSVDASDHAVGRP